MMKRRDFLGLFGAAVAATGLPHPLFAKEKTDFDENLLVFLSDVHAGVAAKCKCAREKFAESVKEILSMNPLPRNVLVFGDIAYLYGLGEDYDHSRPGFKLLEDAGIRVTIGMGNHDRRSEFAARWPEAATQSLVPGRFVHLVETSGVGFLMLDSLQGADNRPLDDKGPVPGALPDDEQVFLRDFLEKRKKPVILCAHHTAGELKVCGRPMTAVVAKTDCVAAYIHGHNHRWISSWSRDKDCPSPQHPKWELCLPSNGLWGDIGYAICRVSPNRAVVKKVVKDFWLPRPLPKEKRPADWDDILADRRASGPYTIHL
ncbi:MAG: metallophosphoesterase [Kiritimatiellae bacterium]|nr:metallophosphoesterase [Kiritimatiellia bacterium]